jgi:hypothetical protein
MLRLVLLLPPNDGIYTPPVRSEVDRALTSWIRQRAAGR